MTEATRLAIHYGQARRDVPAFRTGISVCKDCQAECFRSFSNRCHSRVETARGGPACVDLARMSSLTGMMTKATVTPKEGHGYPLGDQLAGKAEHKGMGFKRQGFDSGYFRLG